MRSHVYCGLLGVLLLGAGCAVSDSTPSIDDLTGTRWVFETVADQPLPDRAQVSMSFDAEQNRVFGSAGCNRYTAGYTLDESSFRVGVAAVSKMACPDPLMAVEDRFLRALDGFRSAALDRSTGNLQLLDDEGRVSRAFPSSDDAKD